MKVQLTALNLLHQKMRTLIALFGVAFAAILMFMQLGFYGSAATTATVFIDKLDFDLILLSPDYLDINRPGTFARARMAQANSVPGVQSVVPLYVAGNLWRIVDMDDGKPGLRPIYHPNYYGAFVLDPDGHKIEACCHGPA